MEKYYNIVHQYDVDGGYGDAIPIKEYVATIRATEDEIEQFVAKWNKPEVYDNPYDDLYYHIITAEEVQVEDLSSLNPYKGWD